MFDEIPEKVIIKNGFNPHKKIEKKYIRKTNKTITHLVECVYKDLLPTEPSTIADYFSDVKGAKNGIMIKFGVYVGMIKILKYPVDKIHNALKSNKLLALIDDVYKKQKSRYYLEYKNILN
jgi:hypothetical protein